MTRVRIVVGTRAYPVTLFGLIFDTFSTKDAPGIHFCSKKWVWEASGFQAHFLSIFCSDLGVPGTAKIGVPCGIVVKNHTFAES